MKVFISTVKNAIIYRFIYIPMAKTPNLPPQPKDHPSLSHDEQFKERLLRQAEDENREFYEMNAEAARRVTDLQIGINEKIIHALTRGLPAPVLPGNLAADRVKEERVQTELYRAVQGNETYETELGEDSRHYRGSENVQYLERNLQRRMGRKFHKVARGAAAMVGFNNYIEVGVNDRFGPDRNILQRRAFVAHRLIPELTALPPGQLAAVNAELARLLALPPAGAVAVVAARLGTARLSVLRNLRDYCDNPPIPMVPIPIAGNEAYLDLMMLVDLDQRVSSKIGLSEVYKEEPLRAFLNDLEFSVPPNPLAHGLKTTLIDTLEPNSLWPLKTKEPKHNPDGIALIAEVRSRINMYVRTGLAANANAAYTMMDAEIQDIVANEVGNVPRTQEEQERIANLQREVSRMVREIRQHLTDIQLNHTRIANNATRLRDVPPPSPVEARQIQAEQASLATRIAERTGQVKSLSQEMADIFSTNGVNHTVVWPTTSPGNAISQSLSATDFLASANIISTLTIDFNKISTDVSQNIDVVIKPKKAKLTPFQLLQRLMRRDYMREHTLDPKEYNEEANHYATVKAALRVEDVKSIDRMRSANARAAEYLNRGLARRGWDRLKKTVSRTQDVIGLEAIDFSNTTADKLLEQIINSNPDFRVFRGINKFTTIRDLRKILNQSGRNKVPREVVERFAATLEEALNMYNKVPPSLAKGLNVEDWDLEQIIEPLKKLKVELWTEELLTQVNASPAARRELAMVQLLRGSREREKQIDDAIHAEVTHENAPWRVQLAKRELKKVLDKDSLDGINKIKTEGIEEKKHRITQKEQELNALPENDPGRTRLQQEIENLRNEVRAVEKQIAAANDLYDRVKKAREYIKANKLGRKAKKEYLASVGLTQVFDKMSQNFRMQDTWAATKRGAKAFWAGTTKAWNWSRKKFLNAATAKSVGRKTFSAMRLTATPVTAPMGWAWKAGTFPFRLVGRAMSRSVDAPWWLAGQVSGTALRRFYRVRAIDEKERLDALVTKRNKMIKKLDTAPYSWDKKRIANKMNRLEERIYKINSILNDVRKSALENKVNLGEMASYSEVANDNGQIIIVQGTAANDNGQPVPKAA